MEYSGAGAAPLYFGYEKSTYLHISFVNIIDDIRTKFKNK